MAIERYEYMDWVNHFETHVNKGDIATKKGDNWNGNTGTHELIKLAKQGDEKLAAITHQYITKYDEIVLPDIRRLQFRPAPGGAFPSVPDYLSNHPNSMRSLQYHVSDRSPIRIFCNVTANWAIKAADIVKRHAAVLAYAIIVNRLRPVELYVLNECNYGKSRDPVDTVVVKIPNTPFSLAHASVALCHVGWLRVFFVDYAPVKFGCPDYVPYSTDDGDGFREKQLELTNKDVLIPMCNDIGNDVILADPPKWILEQVALGLEIDLDTLANLQNAN